MEFACVGIGIENKSLLQLSRGRGQEFFLPAGTEMDNHSPDMELTVSISRNNCT